MEENTMTLEVKFKVRDIRRNKWISPNIHLDYSGLLFWSIGGIHDVLLTREEQKELVVLLSTRLKDELDKEIYEGDILQWHDSKNVKTLWEVKATDSGWNPFIDDMQTDSSWHYRIIGNIYDNPELVELVSKDY